MTIPTVVPVPRMSYDVPYSPTYPTTIYPTPQPNYNNTPPAYPEVYNGPSHNMVLMNGQQFGPQPDFAGGDAGKRLNWEAMVCTNRYLTFFYCTL